MRSGAILVFTIVFSLLLGVYIARSFFPVHETREIVRTILQESPPEVIERVRVDTTVVTKWKTRILYKALQPRQIIEIPSVELDTLNWAVLSWERSGDKLVIDTYHLPSSKLLVSTFDVEHDYKLSLNQYRKTDPWILLEERDIFDLVPSLYLGYTYREGPTVELRGQRVWKIHLDWIASPTGLTGKALFRVR